MSIWLAVIISSGLFWTDCSIHNSSDNNIIIVDWIQLNKIHISMRKFVGWLLWAWDWVGLILAEECLKFKKMKGSQHSPWRSF